MRNQPNEAEIQQRNTRTAQLRDSIQALITERESLSWPKKLIYPPHLARALRDYQGFPVDPPIYPVILAILATRPAILYIFLSSLIAIRNSDLMIYLSFAKARGLLDETSFTRCLECSSPRQLIVALANLKDNGLIENTAYREAILYHDDPVQLALGLETLRGEGRRQARNLLETDFTQKLLALLFESPSPGLLADHMRLVDGWGLYLEGYIDDILFLLYQQEAQPSNIVTALIKIKNAGLFSPNYWPALYKALKNNQMPEETVDNLLNYLPLTTGKMSLWNSLCHALANTEHEGGIENRLGVLCLLNMKELLSEKNINRLALYPGLGISALYLLIKLDSFDQEGLDKLISCGEFLLRDPDFSLELFNNPANKSTSFDQILEIYQENQQSPEQAMNSVSHTPKEKREGQINQNPSKSSVFKTSRPSSNIIHQETQSEPLPRSGL